MRLSAVSAVALLFAAPAVAQRPAPVAGSEVTVTGRNAKLSGWREAETAHVVVLSDGSEAALVKSARNLERLHFLLSVLMNRVDKPEHNAKLHVTLIGDVATFDAMELKNLRWQQGPFPREFDISRYYDPREDGAVMATTRIDQKVVTERGVSSERLLGAIWALDADPTRGANAEMGSVGRSPLTGLSSLADRVGPANEKSVPLPADYLLYAGFAQHFLLTYFPAAYPRWYLDGFGQVFASIEPQGDTAIDYGRVPVGTTSALDRYGRYPLARVFDGSYLTDTPSKTRWTPTHAWALTHFLLFSDAWRPKLRAYLLAYANGASPAQAATELGDMATLTKDLAAYYRARKPYERLTYPADRASDPIVRRLTQGEAAFVNGRIELGSRVEIPPAPAADASPEVARRMTAARTRALADRDRWLDRLRGDARRYPDDAKAQLLLAEAECRSDHPADCLAAADRTLALTPDDVDALAWKGMAQVAVANAGPAAARADALRAARVTIARANRADTDAVLPLLAYYRSYAGGRASGGEPPTPLAIDALAGVVARVPEAPGPRVTLGNALAARGATDEAVRTLRPVALGGWDSPEKAPARAALAAIPAKP